MIRSVVSFTRTRVLSNVDVYLRDISRKPKLSDKESIELGKRKEEESDPVKRDTLVKELFEKNLFLVVHEAKKFNWIPIMDLIAVGNDQLWEAAENYNPEKGLFSSYACVALHNRFRNYRQCHTGPIDLPQHKPEQTHQYKKIIRRWRKKYGGRPSVPEIASVMYPHCKGPANVHDANTHVWDIIEALKISRATKRRRAPVEFLPDVPSTNPALLAEQNDLVAVLKKYIAYIQKISPQEAASLTLYYLEGRTEQEVADTLGCKRQTVNWRNKQALNLLRALFGVEAQPREKRSISANHVA